MVALTALLAWINLGAARRKGMAAMFKPQAQ